MPAELRDTDDGVLILLDGHPQSFVADDPRLLAFEYVQHLGAVLDLLPPGPLRITHVGGAGLTLPRYVHATRPGSPQIVLEPDESLTTLVRERLPLPRGHRIRVRPQRGEDGITQLRPASADVLVLDAFTDGQVPAALTTTETLTQVAGILAPGGLLLANLPDEPNLRYLVRVARSAADAGLPEQQLLAGHEVLKGRRYGNLVLVASRPGEGPDPRELSRAAASAPFPTGHRGPAELARRRATARPSTTADPAPPPVPPDPGRWRLR